MLPTKSRAEGPDVTRGPGSARFVVASLLGDDERPARRDPLRQGLEASCLPSANPAAQLAARLFPRGPRVALAGHCVAPGRTRELPAHGSHGPAPVDDAGGASARIARIAAESRASRFAAMGDPGRVGAVSFLWVS